MKAPAERWRCARRHLLRGTLSGREAEERIDAMLRRQRPGDALVGMKLPAALRQVIVDAGSAIQSASAAAPAAIAAMSKRPSGCGRRPGFMRTSQLRVKLGTMRPPISMMRTITAAIARRGP